MIYTAPAKQLNDNGLKATIHDRLACLAIHYPKAYAEAIVPAEQSAIDASPERGLSRLITDNRVVDNQVHLTVENPGTKRARTVAQLKVRAEHVAEINKIKSTYDTTGNSDLEIQMYDRDSMLSVAVSGEGREKSCFVFRVLDDLKIDISRPSHHELQQIYLNKVSRFCDPDYKKDSSNVKTEVAASLLLSFSNQLHWSHYYRLINGRVVFYRPPLPHQFDQTHHRDYCLFYDFAHLSSSTPSKDKVTLLKELLDQYGVLNKAGTGGNNGRLVYRFSGRRDKEEGLEFRTTLLGRMDDSFGVRALCRSPDEFEGAQFKAPDNLSVYDELLRVRVEKSFGTKSYHKATQCSF